jgi:monovalent cation/hydrogen antiporter
LPAATPQRGTLLFIAFAVIIATLVIPGLTLPLLTRALGVQASAEAEEARLRPLAWRATKAALGRLRDIESEDELPGDVLDTLRNRARGLVALAGFEPSEESQRSSTVQRVHLAARAHAEMLAAARLEIVAARSEPGIDPKAVDELLRRLDLQSARFELLAATRLANAAG